MRPLLTVRDITREFNDVTVLAGVSFDLDSGQAAVLIGPNGSGKTTLLRCVTGVDIPDGGEVLLAGEPLVESDPKVRSTLAVALDDADFFAEMSVVEHLELLARAHGVADPGPVVEDTLSELDLTGQRDQLPLTLSSGQRRRLTLGACLVRPRRLLVLDEPEQRLDVSGRVWLAQRLRDEKARGCAILLATHDPQLADSVADLRIDLG